MQQPQSQSPLASLPTGADGSIVGENNWQQALMRHVAEESRCHGPLACLLAGAEGGTVSDGVGLQVLAQSVAEEPQCQWPAAGLSHALMAAL